LEYSWMHSTEQISQYYFLLFSLLFGVSFLGVSFMWKLKKAGFFIYSIAQAAIFSLPLLWIGKEAFSSVVLIFTAMFIGAYATQYRKLIG